MLTAAQPQADGAGVAGESRWLIESIVDSLEEAVIQRGPDDHISAWNRAAARLYGYSEAEALGHPFSEIVARGHKGIERRITRLAFHGSAPEPYETVRRRRDGAEIAVSVRMSPIRDPSGTVVGVATIEHAVAADLRAVQLTTGVEAHLRSAFEDAPIGTALVSNDAHGVGHFLRVNRAFCELTGYSVEQLDAADVRSIMHPDDVEADVAAMASLIAGDVAGFRLEQRLMHADRHTVWAMVNASLVHDEEGVPLYCIRQIQDIEDRKRFEGELGFLAEHDPLTGLLNRRGFVRELTQQMAHSRRYGASVAVLFLDLDNFKYVNDTVGHTAGDEVISGVAAVVSERLRETDVFARLGGDEFAIMLPSARLAGAKTLAGCLLDAVRGWSTPVLGEARVTASIGVIRFVKPGRELSADDVLADADLAMYAAKESGKDRVAIASPATRQRMRSRVTWAERVRRAVTDATFQLYAQPIIDLADDSVSHWELLLRMPSDKGELIMPAQFLYTAERSGLIVEIDRWVFGEAIRLIVQQRELGRSLKLAVNLSGRTVEDVALPAYIENALRVAAVDPGSLSFEVTETAAIASLNSARAFALQLSKLGCRFALDDFGAGFGSFYYLKHLPFDYVKIDGEFIRHLPASSVDQLILDSIVQMSEGLGKRTIAEFVGDSATVKVLKQHGVDFGQGYHLGRPRPVAAAFPPELTEAASSPARPRRSGTATAAAR